MPSPELLFLSQFPLPGCSLLLCKENLHSALNVTSSVKPPLICSSKQVTSLLVFPKHFVLTSMPLLSTYHIVWQLCGCFALTLRPGAVTVLSLYPLVPIFWFGSEKLLNSYLVNECVIHHRDIDQWAFFSVYTNTAGEKKKEFIVWRRLKEVNMNSINYTAS